MLARKVSNSFLCVLRVLRGEPCPVSPANLISKEDTKHTKLYKGRVLNPPSFEPFVPSS
jgi:hypothetical protein